ncbi:MarR family winged helix-turn-helix transcriptional regulator [Nocardia tengchongensis]|uniref:MarR family winged helix-turn-helix transcriptional regulator n=1 Tax=Nocardia tengchongensis TaxID=2055889 RepID=UPI00367E1464
MPLHAALAPNDDQLLEELLSFLTRAPSTLDIVLQRKFGLTHFEYRVLSLLAEAPGRRLRMATITDRTGGSKSRLSHVLSKLERAQWVQRLTVPGCRGVYAFLTQPGYDKVCPAHSWYGHTVRELLLAPMNPSQREDLSALVTSWSSRLDQQAAMTFARD